MARRLKRAIKVVLETLPIVPACRRLAGRRLAGAAIAVSLDLEPENRAGTDGPEPWRGSERMAREFVPPLRRGLSEITGAPVGFTWGLRMDEQITRTYGSPTWAAEQFRDDLDALVGEGDQIGLHVHPWRWDDELDRWIVDHRPEWAARCVNYGLDAYEDAFGRPARSFRAGDGAMSGAMLEALGARGVTVDTTLEHGATQWKPFAGETVQGQPFDSWSVPATPYRSSASAFPAPDPASDADPLLVPLLSGPARRGRWAGTLVLGTHPTFFAVRLLFTLLRRRPPILAFAIRADSDLIKAWDVVVQNLEHLARHPGARFTTLSDAAAISSKSADPRQHGDRGQHQRARVPEQAARR
ncbi:MAG TPA: hypothetical protein VJT75_05915 [Thermoleophilaceae bacterium]|nr:hypothetical protein [Thermoleophilaceae bacterium]